MAVTAADLLRIMPKAGAYAGDFVAPLNAAMAEFNIDSPARQAAFLAQIAHESRQLAARVENLQFRHPDPVHTGAGGEVRSYRQARR